jgi:hypothetical protein
MIGIITDVHPYDCFYEDKEELIGKRVDCSEMYKWPDDDPETPGYIWGRAVMVDEFKACPDFGNGPKEIIKETAFHAIKVDFGESENL